MTLLKSIKFCGKKKFYALTKNAVFVIDPLSIFMVFWVHVLVLLIYLSLREIRLVHRGVVLYRIPSRAGCSGGKALRVGER